MSTPGQQQGEQRSSVKLVRNAKGDCQIEVKVYAGTTDVELDETRAQAVRVYRLVEREFYGSQP